MYSEVFAFQFSSALSGPDRLRHFAELVAIPEDDKPSAVYWCLLGPMGYAEFYSGSPDVSQLISARLATAQQQGALVQLKPGLGAALRFHWRMATGLMLGLFRTLNRVRD